MNYTVYKHICPNNKIYIGITGLNINRRWLNGYGYHNNRYFYRAILKYGWDNIKHEILYTNLNKEEAEQKEIELIEKHKSNQKEYGYNISKGGYATSLGTKLSNSTKQKISKATKGRIAWNKGIKRTEEEKQKISLNRSGIVAWNKGKKLSDETRKNISIAKINQNKGKPILCLETNIIYFSSAEAQRKTGIDSSSILKCCRKEKNHISAGKLHWEFVS